MTRAAQPLQVFKAVVPRVMVDVVHNLASLFATFARTWFFQFVRSFVERPLRRLVALVV